MLKTIEITESVPLDRENIWNLPLGENDAEATTVGGYLQKLLWRVWEDGEGFSGKRPFGNSGWNWDLAKPMLEIKLLRGRYYIDEDGFMHIEYIDEKQYTAIIRDLIANMTVKNG